MAIKKKSPTALLIFGAQQETIEAARENLMHFVTADAPPEVIIKALDVYKDLCAVGNVTVSNCNFSST